MFGKANCLRSFFVTIFLSEIAGFTCITPNSCPSNSTSSVTKTSHVITESLVSTMSCTLLTTVYTVPPFSTLCHTKWYNFVLNNFFFQMLKWYRNNTWYGNVNWLSTLYDILLASQSTPLHPGLHVKHAPLCMWHVLSSQFGGTGSVTVIAVETSILTSCMKWK